MLSCLKFYKDENSFRIIKRLGIPVYDIEDLETVDEKLKELKKQNYSTILVSNEVASFSQDIIKKYTKQKDFTIIITPENNNKNV